MKCCVQTKTKCSAYLKTEGNTYVLMVLVDKHNHMPYNECNLNRQILSNSLKRKATKDINEWPMQIIHKTLIKSGIDILTIGDVQCVKNIIYPARKSTLPELPKNQDEVHSILDSLRPITTNKQEPFLPVNDSESGIVMFPGKSCFQFLAELGTVYIDGTSKVFSANILNKWT